MAARMVQAAPDGAAWGAPGANARGHTTAARVRALYESTRQRLPPLAWVGAVLTVPLPLPLPDLTHSSSRPRSGKLQLHRTTSSQARTKIKIKVKVKVKVKTVGETLDPHPPAPEVPGSPGALLPRAPARS